MTLKVCSLSNTIHSKEGDVYAVRDISFELSPEETLGIVGESGSGKSMVVKTLLGLFPPTLKYSSSGKVWYDSQDLLTLSEEKMQKIRGKEIGMIFQDPMSSLNPTMKIGTQILEGFQLHYPKIPYRTAHEKCLELLSILGIPLPHLRFHQFPHQLSGGMRQRVVIALAAICSPKILIADELTTALDLTLQAQILHHLKALQKKNKMSIIFITHDLGLVAAFCDRVLVMYAGQIVESAPTSTLFKEPRHPYTKSLLASIPHLHRSTPLVAIPGSPPHLSHLPTGCAFCPRCKEAMGLCKTQPPQFHIGPDRTSLCWLEKQP